MKLTDRIVIQYNDKLKKYHIVSYVNGWDTEISLTTKEKWEAIAFVNELLKSVK